MTSQQPVKYLRSVFEEVDDTARFDELISDGIVLARLIALLCPDKVIKIDKRNQMFMKAANVQIFTDYCKGVGIPGQFIPTPTAVVAQEPKAVRDIEICLWIIAKLSKVGVWEGMEKNVNLEGIEIAEIKPLKKEALDQPQVASQIVEKREKPKKSKVKDREAAPAATDEEPQQEAEPKAGKNSAKHRDEKKQSKKEKAQKDEQHKDKHKDKAEKQEKLQVAVNLPDPVSAAELERAEQRACYEKQDMTILRFPVPESNVPTYCSNIIVAGEPNIGKTTFCMRLHTGKAEYDPADLPSVFERKYLHQVDGQPANLHLKMRESNEYDVIKDCNFLFLCFSFASRASFDAIPKYLKMARKARIDVILLGLQADNKTAGITFEMIYAMLGENKRYLNSFAYHSLSATKGYGIGALLDGLEFYTNRTGTE